MPGHVLVSVSSIFDDTLDDVDRLVTELDRAEIPVSLLVAPHIDKKWHLAKDKKTRKWLEAQREVDRALILNGFDQPAQGRRAEFATLAAHEARLRLAGATRQMESLGFTFNIFAPPRWNLSEGTLKVLPDFGFLLVASTKGLHQTDTGMFYQCRNLSVGEGYGAARWWRRNIIRAAERGASRGNIIRLSVSGRELGKKKVRRDFIDAAAAAVDEGAEPADYRSFLA
ncbi:DUF2334 domain-containing protein [Corynebacterium liangguodongii]|uniref:DUF2334 domain-containing protein n=1 Tax=Corynebacterium liangguodongii TaxID=2079535 RepID=A0A2S0WG09_9CORY|nr:DUF2334 domain-containing protein [Corynebacterium liangguodongii]AWB84622.1 DUF2334 domain-containing protein [Corynebacterium liangguodongii]PWB99630.1 DUF2334 domain-containing protein [Corynebacterium liangguodongii]